MGKVVTIIRSAAGFREHNLTGKSNYLSRLAEPEKREYTRRKANKPGEVFYLKRGLRGYTSQPGILVNISEGGCKFTVDSPSLVSDHVYLVLDGIPAKFPAVVVVRSDDAVHLKFASELPTQIVRKIVSARRPSALARSKQAV